MSQPAFLGDDLTTRGGRVDGGSKEARFTAGKMPGVDGTYIQQFGLGATGYSVTGQLEAAAKATTELATEDLELNIATFKTYINAAPSTLSGTAPLLSYDNCILLSYDKAGPILHERTSTGDYKAFCPIVATFYRTH